MWPIMLSGLDELVVNLKDHNPVTLLCISAAASITLAYVIRLIITAQRDRAFASKHGCKLAQSVMPKSTDFWLSLKDIANKTYLDTSVKRYAKWSTTYEARAPGFAKEVFTIDPENMKTILASNFELWELGSRRRLMLRALIQNSIFVVDGKAWEHSRVSKRQVTGGPTLMIQSKLITSRPSSAQASKRSIRKTPISLRLIFKSFFRSCPMSTSSPDSSTSTYNLYSSA
jgi:hypothetical protein